jgi:hypothetical protein
MNSTAAGSRSRLDRFVFLASRLAELGRHIDEARRDNLAGRVDDLLVAAKLTIQRGDFPVLDT